MSDLTDDLRQVASEAPPGPWVGVVGAATTQIFAGDGSFVLGADLSRRHAHRYACTFDPELVTAMLDVIDAAEHYRYISEEGLTSLANRNADQASWEDWDQERQWAFDAMRESLARFREVAA